MSDLISRQAAIDAIKTWGLIDGLSEGQAIEILADEEKLPSAQPEQQWIPCSERLPVEGESVLLCDRNGDMTLGRLIRTDEGYKWDIYAWWNDIDDWNAWMPLPEPFKGVTE